MYTKRGLLIGASALVLAIPAFAQSSPSSSTPKGGPKAEVASLDEIVVTGSRVITNGDNSPTPLTVVTTEKLLQTTPSTVADALRKLPVFSGSRSAATINNPGSNNVGNFMNLRGFGVIRTLILLDGKRVPATNADGTIDTNILPEMLLQRVDVVTGGASAVYGSDAVTGVVNYVLDKKFTGLKLEAQSGVSEHGDAKSWRTGIAGGANLLDERGHFEASYEHFTQDGIDSKLARPNGRLVYSEQGAGTAANPFHLVANSRNNNSSFGGLILSGPLAGNQFAGDGATLVPFVHGASTGSNGIESGGDGSYFDSAMTAGLKTDRAFGRFDYDLTENVKAYAQLNWARSENTNSATPFLLFPFLETISATNPYLSPAIQAQLAGSRSFFIGRVYNDIPGFITKAVTRNIDATIGLEGKLGGRFNWDLFYTHGENKQRVSAINNINLGKLSAALDTVNVGGAIQCRASTGIYAGCVPFNPFVSGQQAIAAINWIRGNTHFDLTNKLDDFGGSVSGSPFEIWAGPVRVALSGEYRRVSLENVSNAQPSAHPDCTGILVGCNAAFPLWLGNTVADAHGKEDVEEGAFEVNAPLLRDMAFAKSIDLNGAVRYTHYSTSGGVTTWKVGGDWHVNDVLSFRATRSQDIRAPNLNELFAPVNASKTGFNDSHTSTGGVVTQITQGNPDLKPEEAQTLTVGMVIRPAPRLSMSIDYYHIKIDNAIVNVGGLASLQACEQSNGTSPLCALYVRPLPFSDRTPANYPTAILFQGMNAASSVTKGVDAEINYSVPLGSGALDLRGLLSWQPTLETTLLGKTTNAAGAAGQQATAGQAKWRATLYASFHDDYWGVDLQERWRDSLKQSGDPTRVYSDPKVPSAAFTDLTLTAHPGGRKNLTAFLSVQNLFNKTAPVFILPNFAANPGFYYPAVSDDDVIGRYFTFGVRAKF